MTTITVSVTQEDIENGERCSSSRCAFALALLRVLPEDTHLSVGVPQAFINGRPLNLPEAVKEFTFKFDMAPDTGEVVEPTEFELDLGDIL
jgi:hypothetical protein